MRQRTTPTWTETRSQGSPRLRVLVESADPALALSDFSSYTRAGIDVALCCGPADSPTECPLVRGEECGLAGGADAVLFELGAAGGEGVLEALRRRHEGTPVVIQPSPSSVEGQISALRSAALAGRRREA